MKEFLKDVQSVRDNVRKMTNRGAVCDIRETDTIIELLNQALALNFVCVLRHMRHFVTADRLDSRVVAQEFLEHTVRESEHSDQIDARIRQLGGETTMERNWMASRGHFTCETTIEFEEIIRVDLEAEQVAIEAYAEMITWLDSADSISSLLLRRILSLEEEHADVMMNFVAAVID